MRKFSTYKMLMAGIAVVVLTIALILYVTIRQSQRVRGTVAMIDHTQEVLHHIQLLFNVALDNETGARGFVITGNDDFLQPLIESKSDFKNELDSLRKKTADNPLQQQRLDSLSYYIDNRIRVSDNMVSVRREQGLEVAVALVDSKVGKSYMDSIRGVISRMEETENQLLALRRDKNDRSITQLNTILYCMLAGVFILSLFIIRRIRNDINRQRENEQRFSALLDAAPDPTLIVNDMGTIKMVNRQVEKMFGYNRKEILDQPLEILLPHDRGERHQLQPGKVVQAANDLEGNTIELNALKKTGQLFPVEINLSPIQTNDGILVSAALRDITERKAAADQISQLARLVENTSEAMFATDTGFFVRTWNRAAEKLYGFSEQEAIGQPVAELLRPQISPEFRQQIRKEMREIGYWQGEVVHLDRDGKPLELLVANTASFGPNGELEGFVNVCRDISERKAIERQVRDLNATLEKRVEEKTKEILATEAQLRHTLDNMLEGAQIIDFNWRYIYVNDSLTRHAKYSREEMIGYTVMEKYPGIEETEIYSIYKRCLFDRESIHLENEFRFPDNSTGWFELSFQPVPEGIFILSVDITERKRAQFEIEQMNEELERKVVERTTELQRANKELESFTYSVSHDLRAPLRIIDGYADILTTDYREQIDAEGNRVLGIIKTNARRMGQLIDDLLNLSQVGRKELVVHPVDMQQLVQSVVEEQCEFSGCRAAFEIGTLLPAKGDTSLLRQVWINLVSNAIKYSGKHPSPRIEISSTQKGMEIEYCIQDNGVGFDMKYQEKLFGVFQRLHKITEFEGTGIGLALVNRIVSKHGGRIWADATPGRGATFCFTLPIVDHVMLTIKK